MEERMPSDADTGYLYFGLFTWKDIVRLGLPVGMALWCIAFLELALVGAALTLTVGLLLGVVWASVEPYDQPLEVHLYHKLRWLLTLGAPA